MIEKVLKFRGEAAAFYFFIPFKMMSAILSEKPSSIGSPTTRLRSAFAT
jgi:hypothetical protein